MKPGDLLFVYGSLRKDQGMSLAEDTRAEFVQDDTITGDIFNVSWFPGVKLEGKGTVKGEVYKLGDETLIRRLDSYEGYPSLFDRSQTETGGGLKVWVYTINRECGENERIATGDWLNQTQEEKAA